MATKKKMLQAAAGNAGGGAGLNVEEVFSTYLYEGQSTTLAVNNSIDLSGEDGLTWIKCRNAAEDHFLFSSLQNASNQTLFLKSNTTNAATATNNVSQTSTGFSLPGGDGQINQTGNDYASWTFRKAPKFFDAVTYTGTGSAQNISHDLGSVPGMIIAKRTDSTGSWITYHRSLGNDKYLLLQETNAAATGAAIWDSTTPTDSVFTVGALSGLNLSGATYVAYLFAHNNNDGDFGSDFDQDIIKCGAATNVNGSGDVFYDLGFEPQWLLWKQTNTSRDWYIFDNMRGVATGGADAELRPSKNDAEDAGLDQIDFNATGFTVRPNMSGLATNGSSDFIYIAIRRGTKVPESATEVFAMDTRYSAGSNPAYRSGWPVDMDLVRIIDGTNTWSVQDRLRGKKRLNTNSTDAESAWDERYDFNNGWGEATGADPTRFSWMWKRAPGYFDAVAFSGDSNAGRTVSHNLGVAPEMMWIKKRSGSYEWIVYSPAGDGYLRLNTTEAYATSNVLWNATSPTSTEFTLGGYTHVNGSGEDYIAYLFSSLDGISKVGSFSITESGGDVTVDCGFTSGARFILLKSANTTSNWYVFDTERGIVSGTFPSGTDPYLTLNTTDAENNSFDAISPTSSGFIARVGNDQLVPGLIPDNSTVIYLAIA